MSFDADKLYELLPAVYRTRDAEQGYPLKQLVAVIADQVAVLDKELDQLYDNHFVETAAAWALPYLGDLLGIRGLLTGVMARSPRAEVGHTVAYRRRKGTAPMLELLARDVTGWPARAVEFFERLAATQHLNHLRPHCRAWASLRNAHDLEFVDTPFEKLSRTVEVRRIEPGRGKWNIPNVGAFFWRLRAYSRTASPLVSAGELSPGDPLANRRFRVHPLGFDSQLFVHPVTEDDVMQLAEPINVPLPITRRMLAADTNQFSPAESLYGPSASISIAERVGHTYNPIPATRVIVCDLSDAADATNKPVWNHENKATFDRVALDPMLGRIVFAAPPEHPPRFTSHYGFSFDLGGGEYPRTGSFDADASRVVLVPHDDRALVPSFDSIGSALTSLGDVSGTLAFTESGRFVESLPDVITQGVRVELRAMDGACPAVLLKPDTDGQRWTIRGDSGGNVVFNGLWLAGAIRVEDALGRFSLRHCTIAPGHDVTSNGNVIANPNVSLDIHSTRTLVLIENCILPPLRVSEDGVCVQLRNCIIDAGAEDRFALSNLAADGPAGSWRLENCTVIGKVALNALELASNCIFLGESVFVHRRQEGCVRFSWLPSHEPSRTPRRYQCLPAASGEKAGVRPQFTSLRFGDAAYAQLSGRCPAAIRTGADDGSEMGAFHDLFQPQRVAYLRTRLAESLRFGLEAGVFYES